jgi:hypothetical protein
MHLTYKQCHCKATSTYILLILCARISVQAQCSWQAAVHFGLLQASVYRSCCLPNLLLLLFLAVLALANASITGFCCTTASPMLLAVAPLLLLPVALLPLLLPTPLLLVLLLLVPALLLLRCDKYCSKYFVVSVLPAPLSPAAVATVAYAIQQCNRCTVSSTLRVRAGHVLALAQRINNSAYHIYVNNLHMSIDWLVLSAMSPLYASSIRKKGCGAGLAFVFSAA